MSGPLEGSKLRTLITLATIDLWRWCLHARLIISPCSFCSRRTQAPPLRPVLLAVVSKDIHQTRSELFHSSSSVNTEAACASLVPLAIRKTPKSFMVCFPTQTLPLSMLMLAASCHPNALSEQYPERKMPGFPSELILPHGLHIYMSDNMGSKYYK